MRLARVKYFLNASPACVPMLMRARIRMHAKDLEWRHAGERDMNSRFSAGGGTRQTERLVRWKHHEDLVQPRLNLGRE